MEDPHEFFDSTSAVCLMLESRRRVWPPGGFWRQSGGRRLSMLPALARTLSPTAGSSAVISALSCACRRGIFSLNRYGLCFRPPEAGRTAHSTPEPPPIWRFRIGNYHQSEQNVSFTASSHIEIDCTAGTNRGDSW